MKEFIEELSTVYEDTKTNSFIKFEFYRNRKRSHPSYQYIQFYMWMDQYN